GGRGELDDHAPIGLERLKTGFEQRQDAAQRLDARRDGRGPPVAGCPDVSAVDGAARRGLRGHGCRSPRHNILPERSTKPSWPDSVWYANRPRCVARVPDPLWVAVLTSSRWWERPMREICCWSASMRYRPSSARSRPAASTPMTVVPAGACSTTG